jgi:hypothetical protein
MTVVNNMYVLQKNIALKINVLQLIICLFLPDKDKDHKGVSTDGNEHKDAENKNCCQRQMPRQDRQIPIFSWKVNKVVGIMFHHKVQS